MKICICLGTRPEIIKLRGIIKECQKQGLDYYVIHTGQHYDENMSSNFFKELGLPTPNFNLGVDESDRVKRFQVIQKRLQAVRKEYRPDIVLIQGDVDSGMIAGITAKLMGISLGHVESGLRSNDTIPEEYNRRCLDQISDYLFVPTLKDYKRLEKENLIGKLYLVGNTVCDPINNFKKKQESGDYVYMTLHRSNNVSDKEILKNIIEQVKGLKEKVIFAIHPNTQRKVIDYNIDLLGINIIGPQSYTKNLEYINNANYVITDSGGIQEECACLGKKCIVVRESTERAFKGSLLRNGNLSEAVFLINNINIVENPFNPFKSKSISKDILDIILDQC